MKYRILKYLEGKDGIYSAGDQVSIVLENGDGLEGDIKYIDDGALHLGPYVPWAIVPVSIIHKIRRVGA